MPACLELSPACGLLCKPGFSNKCVDDHTRPRRQRLPRNGNWIDARGPDVSCSVTYRFILSLFVCLLTSFVPKHMIRTVNWTSTCHVCQAVKIPIETWVRNPLVSGIHTHSLGHGWHSKPETTATGLLLNLAVSWKDRIFRQSVLGHPRCLRKVRCGQSSCSIWTPPKAALNGEPCCG